MTAVDVAALAPLRSILEAVGLPQSDHHRPGRAFWLFDDDAGLVGCGGLEGDGRDRLLRSVAVVPARQGTGAGARIVAMLEARARGDGARRLHLLTIGAGSFFVKRGYTPADRRGAPVSIAASEQFTSVCPASATYMIKEVA